MKIEMYEEMGCFGMDITAESLEDAVLLTRFGINSTKELRYKEVFASGKAPDNSYILASMVIGKRKKQSSVIRQAV